ncbi:helix-turn-helix domain-containing protein [Polaromonas sp. YR568]|uniref:helix-turn-helix domain-containing protein n=1 Tax=Polaromonas sp. YR568 TaxID=1855301 RepID=UPI00313823DE
MNIASVLKQEISRVARKEVRSEVQSLKKASSQYRSDIAALKRRVMTLERLVGRLGKGKASAPAADSGDTPTALRFSAKGLAAQRKRLGLSAADAGRILGVSGASVYNWEDGTTRPRASQLPAIAQLRKMGKREAAARLAATAA